MGTAFSPTATGYSSERNAIDDQVASKHNPLEEPLVQPNESDFETFIKELLKLGDCAEAFRVVALDMRIAGLRPNERIIASMFRHAEYARRKKHSAVIGELREFAKEYWPHLADIEYERQLQEEERGHWTKRWRKDAQQLGGHSTCS